MSVPFCLPDDFVNLFFRCCVHLGSFLQRNETEMQKSGTKIEI